MSGKRGRNGGGRLALPPGQTRVQEDREAARQLARAEFRGAVMDTAAKLGFAGAVVFAESDDHQDLSSDENLDKLADLSVRLARKIVLRSYREPFPSDEELGGAQ